MIFLNFLKYVLIFFYLAKIPDTVSGTGFCEFQSITLVLWMRTWVPYPDLGPASPKDEMLYLQLRITEYH